MKKSLLLILSLLLSNSLYAQVESYKIPIVRKGVKSTRLVYNFWSGEYPGPVIDVTKKMTIKAYTSLRKLNEVKKCTISAGLYHPWSQTENSIEVFYSIVELSGYVALKDTVLEEIYSEEDGAQSMKISKGDKIVDIVYLSEGWCSANLESIGGKKSKLEYFCGNSFDEKDFKSLYKNDSENPFVEQWMYLKCSEGGNAFIQDKTLLKMPKVKLGTITGYGDVGPAQD